jgi:hypothetical protein
MPGFRSQQGCLATFYIYAFALKIPASIPAMAVSRPSQLGPRITTSLFPGFRLGAPNPQPEPHSWRFGGSPAALDQILDFGPILGDRG